MTPVIRTRTPSELESRIRDIEQRIGMDARALREFSETRALSSEMNEALDEIDDLQFLLKKD